MLGTAQIAALLTRDLRLTFVPYAAIGVRVGVWLPICLAARCLGMSSAGAVESGSVLTAQGPEEVGFLKRVVDRLRLVTRGRYFITFFLSFSSFQISFFTCRSLHLVFFVLFPLGPMPFSPTVVPSVNCLIDFPVIYPSLSSFPSIVSLYTPSSSFPSLLLLRWRFLPFSSASASVIDLLGLMYPLPHSFFWEFLMSHSFFSISVSYPSLLSGLLL
ncbi:uncharacterized protein EI97DRAFT_180924 [Westerdykella ornata]|uniref:Uncharacterized protein n=1 Tax=Westerdykella ornata TaxID=318751 RepID=A0A6A6JTZ5_WESOR|nr:uncharacterized protein EI97DRAFT_180924 [Westerdykella ornata]KAF2279583.1 hypothetical protein EI97DRAFT_180924 [Westerdykella ornata]